MNLLVNHKDRHGVITDKTFSISRLAFIKHMAIAGQGYAPRPQKLLRTIGMLFHYSYYLNRNDFYAHNRFSTPPQLLSDPTEQGQFSTLVGKAIGDFLSKKIDGSILTVNYEAIGPRPMRRRPDLVAFTQNSVFTLEAKARANATPGNMANHKIQAASGALARNFSVACISYHIYNRLRCNYHDPYNENVPFNNELLSALSKDYYSGLAGFLNRSYFDYREVQFNGEKFYEIDILNRRIEKTGLDLWMWDILHFYRPSIILPGNIREYAKNGISKDSTPFNSESLQENNIYIDNDRVGLLIR